MSNFVSFHATFESTLQKFAPLRKKKIRYNNQRFMVKLLLKAILIRSKLKNKYNKERNSKRENWCEYNRQPFFKGKSQN